MCAAPLLIALIGILPGPNCGAEPARLLVKNAFVFTLAEGRTAPFLGYIVVEPGGLIAEIGPGEMQPDKWQPSEVLDAQGMWLFPGFVSAHSHLWQSAYRGLASDKTLFGWADAVYGDHAAHATPEDFYFFTLHGAVDHLRNGITAAYNFAYGNWRDGDFSGEQFRGAADSGLRFVHGHSVERLGRKTTLPEARASLAALLAQIEPRRAGTPGFLGVMLHGAATYLDSAEQAEIEGALMREFGVANQMHYLESPPEKWQERARFKSLMNAGVVTNRAIFGHFVHADPYILAETVKAGAAMTWNPLSNGRLASGTPDIVAYRKAGLRIGMGVDGQASADLADPFENMRAGLYAVRARAEDATVLSPYDVFRMQTMGSAEVLGVSDKIGSLEPGKLADFCVFDPSDLGPVFDPWASLVFAGTTSRIEGVYVGGILKVRRGTPLAQDWSELKREVVKRVMRVRSP